MPDLKERLVRLLAERAYTEGDVTLASGVTSGVYLDAKAVTYLPAGVELVGQAVMSKIAPHPVTAVGGLTIGADAIVSAVVHASTRAGTPLPGFIVRKEPKVHGLGKRIEGVRPKPGSRVAVVDDVVTSGGSVVQAINALQDAGASVAVVVPLVDREQGGREKIEGLGIAYEPVCTLSEVREARSEGLALR